jgi:polysaccharide biosynthesis transport protein
MNETTTDASAMFAPIWRRKWLILMVGILVALGTYFYYRRQSPHFEATTQIYLGAGAEEQVTLTGTLAVGRKANGLEPAAQAVLINSPIIKTEVRQKLRAAPKSKATRAALRGKVKAKATEKSEFISITAEARNKKGAVLLADTTAETYIARQNARYHRAIEGAISITRREMRRITASQEAAAEATHAATKEGSKEGSKESSATSPGKATGSSNVLQLASLSSKLNQLEGNLGIRSVNQVSKATPRKLSASPQRNAIFGLLVGLLLAAILAYVLARLDPRLRTLSEIESSFSTDILTTLPAVRRPIVQEVTGPRPARSLYEPLGRLYTSLQVAAVPGDGNGQSPRPRTVLFTSAGSGDGKSTVVAGMALVQRDAGASVAVVEADLRRPTFAKLLGVAERPGLVDVLEGRLMISEALQVIGRSPTVAPHGDVPPVPTQVTTVQARSDSVAALVGTQVANPATVLAGAEMADTLRALAGTYDYVLIDAPPPLELGDSIPLLSLVDAVVVVARAGQTSVASAQRLMQLIRRTTNAPVLGIVANGVSAKDSRRFGFSGYNASGWRTRLAGR